MYHHDEGRGADEGDRRDIAEKLKLRLWWSRPLIILEWRSDQKRVAVRRRAHDRLGGEIGAGAGPVLDDELLAETIRQPLPESRATTSGALPAE